jgi:hypothetical protein
MARFRKTGTSEEATPEVNDGGRWNRDDRVGRKGLGRPETCMSAAGCRQHGGRISSKDRPVLESETISAGVLRDSQVVARVCWLFKVPHDGKSARWLVQSKRAMWLRDFCVIQWCFVVLLGEFATDIPRAWLLKINDFQISKFSIFLSLRASKQEVA